MLVTHTIVFFSSLLRSNNMKIFTKITIACFSAEILKFLPTHIKYSDISLNVFKNFQGLYKQKHYVTNVPFALFCNSKKDSDKH